MQPPPKLVKISEQKRLAELAMEVQETSRKIANQRITQEEIEVIFTDLTNHVIGLHKIYLDVKDYDKEGW